MDSLGRFLSDNVRGQMKIRIKTRFNIKEQDEEDEEDEIFTCRCCQGKRKYLGNIYLEMLPRKEEMQRTRGKEDFRSKGRNAWSENKD